MQMNINHKFCSRTYKLGGRLLSFSQTNAVHPSYPFSRLTLPPNHTATNFNWVYQTLTISVKLVTKTPKRYSTFFCVLHTQHA